MWSSARAYVWHADEEETDAMQPQRQDEAHSHGRQARCSATPDSADEQAELPNSEGQEEARVLVILQTRTGQRQQVRILANAPFSRLFEQYPGLNKGMPAGSKPTFWLDGEKISGSSSPADLDVEDETVIDVQW